MTDSASIKHFADGALRLFRSDEVATLELHRPAQRNAITVAMWNALPEVAADVASDPAIRVLLVRGSGDEAFSAGADLAELPEIYGNVEHTRAYVAAMHGAERALRDLSIPTIALIRGFCLGGGCGLALACDLRYAASDASFGIPASKLGLAYSFSDTAALIEAVGPARAKDLLFSGRVIEAQEALSIGLVDLVARVEAVDGAAAAYASILSRRSSASLRFAKATVNALARGSIEETDSMRRAHMDVLNGPDFRERHKTLMKDGGARYGDFLKGSKG